MKTINVPFEDKDYEDLLKAKGELSWHDFILTLAKRKGDKKK
jgi:predicted CopG family antitoxin